MKKNIEKKSLIINNTSLLLKESSIISLVSYVGLKSFDLKILRRFLAEKEVLVKVVKNSLAEKVFKTIGYDVLIDSLSGQSLIIASKNIFSMLLAIEHIKKNNDKFIVKKVAIGNCLVSDNLLRELLFFGSDVNIISKLLFVLKNPLLRFVNLLKLPMCNLTELIKILNNKGGHNNVN
ncbi:MAG TPA: 50S ribosomal protein L10 [Candidatus Azoamicus sp. MARI]